MPKQHTKYAYGRRKRNARSRRTKAQHNKIEKSTGKDEPETSFGKRRQIVKQYGGAAPETLIKEKGGYQLIHSSALSALTTEITCQSCSAPCTWRSINQKGFSSTIEIFCKLCGNTVLTQPTSSTVEVQDDESGKKHKHQDVNLRAALSSCDNNMHLSGLLNHMAIMNVNGTMSGDTYYKLQTLIHTTNKETLQSSMQEARLSVKKYYQDTFGWSTLPIDIGVSFDGTWHTRGYKSHYGAAFCIDVVTGIIVDLHVMSNYCKLCETVGKGLSGTEKEEWLATHKPDCDNNYEGSSPAMEVTAAQIMWERSESLGFRYTTLVSDGDSAVFSKLQALKPYDVVIEKQECINHVAKRMFAHLEKTVKDERRNGFTIDGGKEWMKKWGQYYRNAITTSAPDVHAAHNRVWAILHHFSSTPQNPKHDWCGDWCYYRQAKKEGKMDPVQVPERCAAPLSAEITQKLTPVFQKLADKALLRRCMGVSTQNANESLHSTIWTRCSKTKFPGRKFLEMAVFNAVQKWNYGAFAPATLASKLGINMGQEFAKIAKKRDHLRIKQALCSEKAKHSRKQKALQEIKEQERIESLEGVSYQSGMF